ncbi:M23 family metallopeptidase [Faunimonas pinastri]|uniref:M23 family metallopeptidase n=1 Tax=Faunimonas pinastri TaxID=1855383 RepID=UPI0015A5B1D5|nr:M23 family metallopeptidase [Faunimonas pinastri]
MPKVIIAHGDGVRAYTVRPWMMGGAAAIFLLFGTGYIGATVYLISRDGLLGGLLQHQVSMQYSYEDRIAALRADVERVTSQRLVESQNVGDQVALLVQRQEVLDHRQDALDGLVAQARDAGVVLASSRPAPRPRSRPIFASKDVGATAAMPAVAQGDGPAPMLAYAEATQSPDTIITGSLIRPVPSSVPVRKGDMQPLVEGLRASIGTAEDNQSRALTVIDEAASREAAHLGEVAAKLGIKVAPKPADAQGGPFVPATDGALRFVDRIRDVHETLKEITGLRGRFDATPLAYPIANPVISSTFGYRRDPFLGRLALHSGIDFAEPMGTAARVTAPGKVVFAGWSNGYGQMVEVQHAGGLSTRYGHLSEIDVRAGQTLARGDVIGRVGETGRATGPHLHYETRRNGEAVDPAFYLEVGREL